LRTRRTQLVALLLPDLANPFYPASDQTIQDVSQTHALRYEAAQLRKNYSDLGQRVEADHLLPFDDLSLQGHPDLFCDPPRGRVIQRGLQVGNAQGEADRTLIRLPASI
jgi:hypothetical protein